MNKTLLFLALFCPLANTSFAQCSSESFKLLDSTGAAGDFFSWSVAVNNTRVLVGADSDDDQGLSSGSAHVFDANSGLLLHKFTPSDGAEGHSFGFAVALEGTSALIGATGDSYLGFPSGSAYLFDIPTGVQVMKLIPGDGEAGDEFGNALALAGGRAIVGSRSDDDLGSASGSAYLFDTMSGALLGKWLASDGAPGDQFGFSVAMAGGLVLIGAPEKDNAAGAAYIFDAATGQQLHKLFASDAAAGDRFGTSLSISGNLAIVGASCDDDLGSCSGAAYLFDVSSGQEIDKLLPDDGAAFDFFGASLAIDGTSVVVGAYGDHLGVSTGTAYLFDALTGQQTAKLLPSDGMPGDFFGRAVAISATKVVAGAIRHADFGGNSGAAYLFSTEPLGTSYCSANSNSTGQPAHITACGRVELSSNNFSLSATPVPNGFYLFFYGTDQVQVPFGEGFLCASGVIQRLGAPQVAKGNLATIDLDLPSSGIVSAGTSHFQCWFRDQSGGPFGFNLSDGLSVTFVP